MSSYVTAYDHFNESRNTLKMTTGSANLDSLIDSIQEGEFYLFYGSNRAILDRLVYGLLVDCILPRQRRGFESMAFYISNVDYYQPDKSKVLSPEKIAIAASGAIEPKIVFKNLFVQIAYNQKHRLVVAKQVSDFIESRKQDIRSMPSLASTCLIPSIQPAPHWFKSSIIIIEYYDVKQTHIILPCGEHYL